MKIELKLYIYACVSAFFSRRKLTVSLSWSSRKGRKLKQDDVWYRMNARKRTAIVQELRKRATEKANVVGMIYWRGYTDIYSSDASVLSFFYMCVTISPIGNKKHRLDKTIIYRVMQSFRQQKTGFCQNPILSS